MNVVLSALGLAETENARLRVENSRLVDQLHAYKKLVFAFAYGSAPLTRQYHGPVPAPVHNSEARRPPEGVKYTGHGANTGGLQQHSIGPEYPFITYMRGDKWRILDSRTGNTHTSEFVSSKSAHTLAAEWAASVKSGSNIAIQSNGFFGIHKEE